MLLTCVLAALVCIADLCWGGPHAQQGLRPHGSQATQCADQTTTESAAATARPCFGAKIGVQAAHTRCRCSRLRR